MLGCPLQNVCPKLRKHAERTQTTTTCATIFFCEFFFQNIFLFYFLFGCTVHFINTKLNNFSRLNKRNNHCQGYHLRFCFSYLLDTTMQMQFESYSYACWLVTRIHRQTPTMMIMPIHMHQVK